MFAFMAKHRGIWPLKTIKHMVRSIANPTATMTTPLTFRYVGAEQRYFQLRAVGLELLPAIATMLASSKSMSRHSATNSWQQPLHLLPSLSSRYHFER